MHLILEKIFHSESSSPCYTQRKTRSDALSDENRKYIYEFWRENSHPNGNKNDVKSVRIGPKEYSSHTVQNIKKKKTQTEIIRILNYNFLKKNMRLFEACKSYYIRAASNMLLPISFGNEIPFQNLQEINLSKANLYRNIYGIWNILCFK